MSTSTVPPILNRVPPFIINSLFFNQYGKVPDSIAINLRILPKYNLNLVSPAENAIITDNIPSLVWTSETIADTSRFDLVEVYENSWIYTRRFQANFIDGTTAVETSSLEYGILYEWNVQSQYSFTNDATGLVMSLSNPSYNFYSINGDYCFTVVLP